MIKRNWKKALYKHFLDVNDEFWKELNLENIEEDQFYEQIKKEIEKEKIDNNQKLPEIDQKINSIPIINGIIVKNSEKTKIENGVKYPKLVNLMYEIKGENINLYNL